MNAFKRSSTRSAALPMLTVGLCLSVIIMVGCGSSEEAQQEEMMAYMQRSIDSLEAENATLRMRWRNQEQENKNLTAQVADLETKLAEEREKKEAPSPRTANPQMEYDRGLSLHREKNYQEALSVFMGLLNTEPPQGLESNCHYWIGECYYALTQYGEALPHFEKVFGYSRSAKKDDAQLMIANCYKRMGDKERAKQEYQKLIDQYPVSPYVQRAKDELAKM